MVTGLTHQLLLAFLGAMLLGTPGGPKISPSISFYQLIGYNLLIVAAILVLRVLYTILSNR